jgi:hypothetical protein
LEVGSFRFAIASIDGDFVCAAHKEGWFEVIAGKGVVAFPREELSWVYSDWLIAKGRGRALRSSSVGHEVKDGHRHPTDEQ